jgi:uncharacterized protein YbjT (DUF2867 family)
MNSLKNAVAVETDAMHVILGASGNTGSIIASSLLSEGKKVRVVGRDAGRLQRFVRQGAEAFTATVSDAAALSKAFSGARAAYLMLPPAKSREDQERDSDGIAKAVKESGLRYAVHLSSYGAQVPEGTGPVAGLHSSEQKLNAISGLNVLHLRAAYFMENNLVAIGMIHGMGVFGNALLPDLKLPMASTSDVGDYAAQSLLHLDFSGKQTRELLGERDLSMTEAAAVIARGIGKPDLRYEQFPYDQVQQVLTQMGVPPKGAALYIEMYKAINAGVLIPQEPRSPENTTPTSFEQFVQDVFAPAYRGVAATA